MSMDTKTLFEYAVEMYNKETKLWIIESRWYSIKKSLDAIDLKDIPGLRRNAQFVG